MKERPIPFKDEMVRAIMEGRKSQTRRIIKIQPSKDDMKLVTCISTTGDRRQEGKHHWVKLGGENGLEVLNDDAVFFGSRYGKPGDRLWVRETWFAYTGHGAIQRGYSATQNHCEIGYKADMEDDFKTVYRPSIHMPRWASRLTLEVTEVRVERVQEISEEDAIAEGIDIHAATSEKTGLPYDYIRYRDYGSKCYGASSCYMQEATTSFRSLWDSINKKRGYSWQENPWIWVVSFKRIG